MMFYLGFPHTIASSQMSVLPTPSVKTWIINFAWGGFLEREQQDNLKVIVPFLFNQYSHKITV